MINSCIRRPSLRSACRRYACWGASLSASVLVGVGLLACTGADTASGLSSTNTNPYTMVRLNVRAAVMSTVPPYDTLQLMPTAYDANGHVIPLPGPVMYTSNDTTIKVNANGLVTVTSESSTGSYVIAAVQDTSTNLTHADTVFISGTSTVPSAPLASFSIHPTGSDSAVLDIVPNKNSTKALTVTALDAAGKVIPPASLKMHFTSDNPSMATINAQTGVVTLGTSAYPGTVELVASTMYYGVTKSDSLLFRVGYPDTVTMVTMASVLPNGAYNYYWQTSNLIIGVGKTLIFRIPDMVFNATTHLIYAGTNLPIGDRIVNEGASVVFDDSSAVQPSPLPTALLNAQFAANGSGNISLQIPDSLVVVDSIVLTGVGKGQYSVKLTNYCKTAPYSCAAARSFSTAGTYHLHSPTTGAAGTITVVAP